MFLADVMAFPGATTVLRRWSPIGQLAYGPDVAALGFQYTGVRAAGVELDWREDPHAVELVSEGLLLARLRVKDRLVYVDRRCGRALLAYWSPNSLK